MAAVSRLFLISDLLMTDMYRRWRSGLKKSSKMAVIDMTYMDLINEIKALGFSCTYGSFKSKPPIPFCTVNFAYNNDMIADNQNYQDVGNISLNIITQ